LREDKTDEEQEILYDNMKIEVLHRTDQRDQKQKKCGRRVLFDAQIMYLRK
jgi:hypothetical protein